MKGRVIVLAAPERGGSAAALLVNGQLEDLILDPPNGKRLPSSGDICVVRVLRKLPNAGAFCEMAHGQQGYLRNAGSVKERDCILAQVVSIPEPGKAVPLTTRVLVKGPRLILTPGSPGINVSRKIVNTTERARLEDALRTAHDANQCAPALAEMGVIIRTAARGERDIELSREFDCLIAILTERRGQIRRHDGVSEANNGSSHNYALREWLFPRPDAIICEEHLVKFLTGATEACGPSVFFGDEGFSELVEPSGHPFEVTGVNELIDALKTSSVAVSGDASMVVEPTSALVAVDVNTGADFSPAAGLKANLAAAKDLPRQLRLRGLGGQIAVDFAPMEKKHRRTLEEALKKAFRTDPVETSLVGWTSLGLFEIQRKRERRPLKEVL